MRTRSQGVWNVVRFNWPFYALSLLLIVVLSLAWAVSDGLVAITIAVLLVMILVLTALSLLVSFYVYDLSGFYELRWTESLPRHKGERIVNINAGFDETSAPLKERFPTAELVVCDFYDPMKHTETSIARARRAYPPFPGTLATATDSLPFDDDSAERIFAIMSAHEIRNEAERHLFFGELARILSPDGRIVVVEHLRDAANFFAYNLGALHFQPRSAWLASFDAAKLDIERETKITPFVTAFFLKKNGATSQN